MLGIVTHANRDVGTALRFRLTQRLATYVCAYVAWFVKVPAGRPPPQTQALLPEIAFWRGGARNEEGQLVEQSRKPCRAGWAVQLLLNYIHNADRHAT